MTARFLAVQLYGHDIKSGDTNNEVSKFVHGICYMQ